MKQFLVLLELLTDFRDDNIYSVGVLHYFVYCRFSSISNLVRLDQMKELSLALSDDGNHFTMFVPVNDAFSAIPRSRADTLLTNSTLLQNVRYKVKVKW